MVKISKKEEKEKTEEKRRCENLRTEKGLLFFALIATVILFLFGFLLGDYMATWKISEFREIEERLFIDLISLDVRDEVLENYDVCSLDKYDLWKEKESLGETLTILEERFGKTNDDVFWKKQIYELIEIKTITLLEEINQKCNEDFHIILLFYTNQKKDPKGDASLSEDQGKILDTVVNEHNTKEDKKDVFVFVFDINSANAATRALIKKYAIEEAPSMVINEKIYDYKTFFEIEEILERY